MVPHRAAFGQPQNARAVSVQRGGDLAVQLQDLLPRPQHYGNKGTRHTGEKKDKGPRTGDCDLIIINLRIVFRYVKIVEKNGDLLQGLSSRLFLY